MTLIVVLSRRSHGVESLRRGCEQVGVICVTSVFFAGCAEGLRSLFAVTLLRKLAAAAARDDGTAATPLQGCAAVSSNPAATHSTPPEWHRLLGLF